MIMRRTGKALAATGVLGLAIVGLATPSHADTAVVVDGALTKVGTGADAVWANAVITPSTAYGPVITISIQATGSFDNDWFVDSGGALSLDGTSCIETDCEIDAEDSSPVSFAVAPTANNAQVLLRVDGGAYYEPLDKSLFVSYSRPSVAQPTVVSGPAPHIQQFPRPAAGTCDEAEPEGVNWSGVASGSWGESWAKWMNDGEGGDVCTRTLIYNQSTAAWEVD